MTSIQAGMSAVAIGDAMIDHLVDLSDGRDSGFPEANRTYFEPIGTAINGVGLTFAVHLRQCGFETVFVGAVGSDGQAGPDLAGREVLAYLDASGVTAHVATLPGVATGKTCMVYLNPHDRMIVSDRGANAGLGLAHIDARTMAAIDGADILFVSGYFLTEAPQRAAMRVLMRRARAAGALVAVDVVPHEILRHVPTEEYLEWIADANALLLTNATMHDYLGRNSNDATWRSPTSVIKGEDLVPVLERFEVVVCTLNNESDYLVAARDGHCVVRIPHRSFRESLRRDATEACAHILALFVSGGRKIDLLLADEAAQSFASSVPA